MAQAHVLALQHLLRGGDSLALNLGTGVRHSVKQVLAAVQQVTGKPVPHRIVSRRPGDPPELVADPTLAQEVLGWRTERSLQHIVSTAWAWMQTQEHARNGVSR